MLVAAAVALAAASASAQPRIINEVFHTPGRAVQCVHTTPDYLTCRRASDGLQVFMDSLTRVDVQKRTKPDPFTRSRRLLGFGERWRMGDAANRTVMTCRSRRTALTCTNQAGHGWWLYRDGRARIY